jgi:5'-3' exonuclease
MIDEHDLSKNASNLRVFFDYNSLIHPCAQEVLATLEEVDDIELEIIKHTITYTRYIIGILKPKAVHLMIDGVAPRAKINQQRERRYKSMFLRTTECIWDSNRITPGTKFMERLTEGLQSFKDEMKGIVDVHISSANECGEGEQKIIQYLKSTGNREKILIYGLDADLIMLSLVHHLDAVLIRDNTFNKKLKESERTFTYLSVPALKKAITEEFTKSIPKAPKTHNITLDYIVLCFLLGNDFLEHIPSLSIKENGVNALVNCYVKAQSDYEQYKPLVDERAMSINFDVLRDTLGYLSASENYYFSNIYFKRNLSLREPEPEPNDNIHFYKTDLVKLNKPGYKQRYYSYYGIVDIQKACKDYITGLAWTLGYYQNHKHKNWSWFYSYPVAPFASDLFKYLNNNLPFKNPTFEPTQPMLSIEQLMMVLPKKSLFPIIQELDTKLYESIKRKFRSKSTNLGNIYPDKISIDLVHKEYLWQSKIFMEEIDTTILGYLLN